MIVDLSLFFDFALLSLRIIVAIIFFSSGRSHAMQPEKRGEEIGLPANGTFLLGVAEMMGAISVAVGIYIQIGTVLLIGAMLGAIYKKVAIWDVGFYSDEGVGWHYELLLCANLVFLTEGGRLVLIG